MRALKIILIVCTIGFLILCRSQNSIPYFELTDEKSPSFIIGEGDIHDPTARLYKYITQYYVDVNENIYIENIQERAIDKYDPKGNYLLSFGKKGQGPGEFPQGILPFAANSKGLLFTFSLRKKIMIFNPDGTYRDEVNFPEKIKHHYPAKIKIDYADRIHVLSYSIKDKTITLSRFDSDQNNYQIIHQEESRPPTALATQRDLPDFDFDQDGNLYITDNYDYTVFVYSPEGQLIRTFTQEFEKSRITPHDFNFLDEKGKVSELMGADEVLKRLEGKDKFWPAVFGIDVLENDIYVWTSHQDNEGKFIIDIYDKNFNKKAKSSFYNSIRFKLAKIQNNKLYTLNIGSDDKELKNKLGIISSFDIPYKLLVYPLNPIDP
jgi:hypothetical protein